MPRVATQIGGTARLSLPLAGWAPATAPIILTCTHRGYAITRRLARRAAARPAFTLTLSVNRYREAVCPDATPLVRAGAEISAAR
jgi:hypothetical protein